MIATATKRKNGVAMSPDEGSGPEALPVTAASRPLKFQMKLVSDARMLAVVRGTVEQLAATLGFEDAECQKVTLAIDEALSNVIRHAYGNEDNHEIELNCLAQEDCLEFTFIDHGEPPDPERICGQPLDQDALGGRGTHLIRQIMDEVRYERLSDQNRLHLKKYRPGARRQS
jgi:serine/threonine-protein kinase RsbW